MPKLIAVAGLPGSGKSTYIEQLDGVRALSDITQNGWLNWPHLVSSLLTGFDCIIDSAKFTVQQGRKDLEDRLKKEGLDIEVEWYYFENNPNACLTNILRDGILKPEREFHIRLQRLFELAPHYVIPEGVVTLPV